MLSKRQKLAKEISKTFKDLIRAREDMEAKDYNQDPASISYDLDEMDRIHTRLNTLVLEFSDTYSEKM